MFKGRLTQQPSPLTRGERRLAVIARSTLPRQEGADSGAQRFTRLNAQRQLQRMQQRRERQRGHKLARPLQSSADEAADAALASVQWAQRVALQEEDAKHRDARRRAGLEESPAERDLWQRHAVEQDNARSAPLRYGAVDSHTGNSVVQLRFNELVHTALLRFGPPLPPEFVTANDIVTTSSGADSSAADAFVQDERTGRTQRLSWQEDLGADGRSFMMYDEVDLRTHELLHIMRRQKPDFSIKVDCDQVPFSLLIRNCPYLRAHSGKVHYMRYLRRERHGTENRIVVSIAKYKLREAASQDGVRQGPQPWKYSYRMV